MDSPQYALNVFHCHLERANICVKDLPGKVILELGPGDSISTALIAYAYGSKSILVDSGCWVRTDLAPYVELADILTSMGLRAPNFSSISNLHDLLLSCQSYYFTNGLDDLKCIDPESVDFVFSQAVLEHVRAFQFEQIQQEFYRILKPKAKVSHRVDLTDHLSGSLNNLRFDTALWESDLFALSGFYTNRIQMSRMISCFRKVGFIVDSVEFQVWDSLPLSRQKLAKEFQALSDEDLNVSGFNILLSKSNSIS